MRQTRYPQAVPQDSSYYFNLLSKLKRVFLLDIETHEWLAQRQQADVNSRKVREVFFWAARDKISGPTVRGIALKNCQP